MTEATNKTEAPRLRELPKVPIDFTLLVSTLLDSIVGMIELRDPINVCLGMLRMEFKEVKP